MYGVTERTFQAARKKYGWDPKPVKEITREEATVIYWLEFWLASGAHLLAWPLALVHFDAAVNHGVGNARKLRTRANGTPIGYIEVRRAFYAAIIANNPDMAPNKNGWENRMKRLEAEVRRSA
jgi:hypothetical protein